MTHGGELYLVLILVAFGTYVGTLFWAMITTRGYGRRTEEHDRPHS